MSFNYIKQETSTDPKGNITEKIYDRAGRLWKVIADGETTTYTYYDNGSRKSIEYPGGSKEVYEYYANGLLKKLENYRVENGVPVLMDRYEYSYDAANNQVSKTETINGEEIGTTTYAYDSLNRLEKVTEPSGRVTEYTYDRAGNRLSETVKANGTTVRTSYIYNEQNRLMKTITESGSRRVTTIYTYDNNGNLVSTKEEITDTAAGSESYGASVVGVDSEGLRVSKTVN